MGEQNYGQGSSREHAAIAPRFLGLRAVIAKGYARIHRKNLINFGILPLLFDKEEDYTQIDQNDLLEMRDIRKTIKAGSTIAVFNKTKNRTFQAKHNLNARELEEMLAGGLINVKRVSTKL